ncbi:MAG: hypothetical protein M0Z31_08090 [Clostridia bacterium]|nr:hypothetical protein [Clostridia bacterium]
MITFHLLGMMVSGFMFAGGMYVFFGLTGRDTRITKYGGAALSGFGGLIFLFTLFPAF